jgi:hypothetical protein
MLRTPKESVPDPVPKPPDHPPGEPIIIKPSSRPPEVPEIDGCLDEEEENPEIRRPPEIIPETPLPPGPWEQADSHRQHDTTTGTGVTTTKARA